MQSYIRFLAAADERSISRAAERLHISQPAMSRTIALLEEDFGTPLFKRTAEGVELTKAGTILYEYANRAARAISNAKDAIEHAEFGGKLTLTIAAGDGWSYSLLPAIIKGFCSTHPGVTVNLETVELEARTQGLKNGKFDMAFGVLSPEYHATGTLEFQPLMEGPFDVYCHVAHPLARLAQPLERQHLLAYPWISHKFEYDYDPSQSLSSGRNYAIRTNTILSAVEIMQGSEYLISAARWFNGFFARNNIIPIAPDPHSRIFVSGAVFVKHHRLNPAAEKFLAAVIRHCRALGEEGQGTAAGQ